MKVGNGVKAFDALDYVAATAADVYAWAKEAGLSVTVDPTSKGNVVASVSWDSDNNTLKVVKTDAVTPAELKAVTDLIGTLPTTTDAKTIVEYIDKKTEGIATSGALTELSNKVTGVENTLKNKVDKDGNKGLSTNDLTNELKGQYDAAYAHSQTAHAPANAQANIIESVKVNGKALTVTGKEVDISVPTNNKQLTNGAGYLVASDIANKADKQTTLAGYGITDAMTATDIASAIATAKSEAIARAAYDDTALAGRVTAIEGDYLKATDKTELSNAVAAEKTRAEGVEAGLRKDVDAIKGDYLKAEDKVALQNQINTIMNNPDAEGAINSINEFTTYIAEHGTIADGFRTDIDKNKEDIATNAEAIADEAGRADAAEKALAGRLDTLEAINHDAYKAADTALHTAISAEIDALADGAVKNNADAIATLNNNLKSAAYTEASAYATAAEGLKSVTHGDGLVATFKNNVLNIDFDSEITFILDANINDEE